MGKLTYQLLLKMWLQQLLALFLVALSFWWFNRVISYSVFLGGLVYWIPNLYFAAYAFRFRGAQAAQQVLLGFYRGEIGKFILSCVGFAIVFTLVKPLHLLAFFIAYIVLTLLQWLQLSRLS